MVYVYCLIDPRCGTPFYVGATKYPKIRYSEHYNLRFKTKGKDYSSRKIMRVYSIYKAGLKPVMQILKRCRPENATKYEKLFFHGMVSRGCEMLQSPHHFGYTITHMKRQAKKQSSKSKK